MPDSRTIAQGSRWTQGESEKSVAIAIAMPQDVHMSPRKRPESGRPIHIYLDAKTIARLQALRSRWSCTWGEVVRRALEKVK